MSYFIQIRKSARRKVVFTGRFCPPSFRRPSLLLRTKTPAHPPSPLGSFFIRHINERRTSIMPIKLMATGGVAAAIRGPADHRHPNRRVGAEPQDKGPLSQPPPTRRDRKNPSVSPARCSLRVSAPPSSFTRVQGHLGPEPCHLRSPIAVSGRPFSMRLPRCSGIRRCRRVGMRQRSPCHPVLSILAAEEVTFRM